MRKRDRESAGIVSVGGRERERKNCGIFFKRAVNKRRETFRDEFFTDADLYEPEGKNVMLLGLDVLPELPRSGSCRENLFGQYRHAGEKNGREDRLILTCLQAKVEMYKGMGFCDRGIANSLLGRASMA